MSGVGRLRSRVVGEHPLGIRLEHLPFDQQEPGIEAALDAAIVRIVGDAGRLETALADLRDRVVSGLEAALDRGEMRIDDLFEENHEAIPGTNPVQYRTGALTALERILPPLLDGFAGSDPSILFCVASDASGWLPVHQPAFSKPQGADPEWNEANSRNRRIFDDRAAVAAARNVGEDFLVQTYERVMGGGRKMLLRDVSTPIHVKGRHWGALRVGLTFD